MSTEGWKITLVHGPKHLEEGTAPDFAFAEKWAEERDREHHGEGWGWKGLDAMRDVFTSGKPEDGFVQYGTNYHWVTFARV